MSRGQHKADVISQIAAANGCLELRGSRAELFRSHLQRSDGLTPPYLPKLFIIKDRHGNLYFRNSEVEPFWSDESSVRCWPATNPSNYRCLQFPGDSGGIVSAFEN